MISVLIPTHQRAGLLDRALTALGRQRLPSGLEWEIVVANNNCTDDTPEVVRRHAQTAPRGVRQVLETRPGANYARNAALGAAKGEVFACIDDDIEPDEGWLATALVTLDREKADMVGGRILPRWEVPPPPWLLDNHEFYDYLGLMAVETSKRLSLPFRDRPKIWGGNMIFRRSTVDRVGAFSVDVGRTSERLFSGDESDFIRRVLEAGGVVFYDPAIFVRHYVPRERMRQSYFWRWIYGYAQGRVAFLPEPTGRRLFGLPRWMYPRLAHHGLQFAMAPRSLRRQIDFFWELGLFMGWYRRRYPKRSAGR
ncbi:MAG TPA: glycosyltransferase [Methylomirabilota bacterium]|nr:glycosyltransferase [Methylomirabilota bacterium]